MTHVYPQDQGAPGHPGGPKITSILKDFTAESLEELAFWLEQRGIHTPISNILGFMQFTASVDVVATGSAQTTTSTFPVALATAGPQIAGLSDGKYVVIFGAKMHTGTAATNAVMGVSVNGAAASATAVAVNGNTNDVSAVYVLNLTLNAGGNNTLLAKYGNDGSSGATVTFNNRFMIAIRYGN